MSRILHIASSPRKDRSSSIALANQFIQEYQKIHPTDEIVCLDLWRKKLPSFDGNVIDAKYALMHKKPHTPSQVISWKKVEEIIFEFTSFDKYVISLPMWNFGIPYVLKHYLDILVQPGYTFRLTQENGYEGLVKGKKILVVCSRGGAYGPKSGAEQFDFQMTYMNTILRFIGFDEPQSIIIEPTRMGSELKKQAIQFATTEAKRLAANF